MLLAEGVETPGVVWETPTWRLSDTGLIYFKNVSGQSGGKLVKGVQYFGLLDEKNIFRPIPASFSPVTLEQVLPSINCCYKSKFGNITDPRAQCEKHDQGGKEKSQSITSNRWGADKTLKTVLLFFLFRSSSPY